MPRTQGATVAALSKAEINEQLKGMPEWSHAGKAIQKKFTFKSFMPAMAFVNKIAEAAEKAGHHPDMTINYSVVGISLSTHSESGVTEKDFQLARQIDAISGTIS
ncbi:MAG: 4a-hydroxytetrahydrobiopterin dehydratase [Acidobacteria bacterium]|nr:4a-hydroxytetrahydrobiopterin dehydratase [Acidobacteriota bacterium]